MKTHLEIRMEVDTRAALTTAAEMLKDAARSAVVESGCASIALSGGGTPRGMHRLLTRPPLVARVPWERIHLFWADERLVPYDDPASNFGAARADLIEKLPQRPAGVHPIPVAGEADAMARRYEQELNDHFQQRHLSGPVFDLVFLGLGRDGHTASLLPQSKALVERIRWAVAVKGGEPDVWRITLTCAVLNCARRIVFLVTGGGKAAVVRHVVQDSTPVLPAQLVCPQAGQVTWVLDRASAALLDDPGP